MSKVTIREIRLHWPRVERRLRVEQTLTVTRDGTPVAVLSKPPPLVDDRPRFNAAKHMAWLNEQPKLSRSASKMLSEEREE